MPVYEYRCHECKGITTVNLSWTTLKERGEDYAPACTHCGGETAKVMSVPAKPYVRV